MENPVAEVKVDAESTEIKVVEKPKKSWPRNALLFTIALILGYIHYKYASTLFDNDRNFAYLSDLEREMSFRTEMGFYYSYYKTVVEEKPFVAGITKLMYDKLVEFPKDVNALNRFNIHPEVLLGAIYRYFEPRLNTSSNVECLTVDRGEGLPPVASCTGLGVPVLFYLEAIWWLAGVTVAAVFLHATLISSFNAINQEQQHRQILRLTVENLTEGKRRNEPRLNPSSNVECLTVARGEGLPPVASCTGLGVPVLFYLEAIWWLAGVTVAAVFLHATLIRRHEPRLNTSSNVECLTVARGEGLPPVASCTGLGVPVLFYLEAIWWLAGVTVAAVFLHATLIGSLKHPTETSSLLRLNTSSNVECLTVARGEGLPPVASCTGLGVPVLFYLEAIWWLAGVTVAAVFLHATLISESILGGFLAVTQYFANHSELTRVHWAPNERENFAWPLLLVQAWLVSFQIRDHGKKTTFQLQVAIFFLNCTALLFWQFSQFVFLTQIAIFFIMEQLRIINMKAFCIFLHSHFCGLHTAVLLLQGNDMLKSSLYVSFFISVSAYCLFFSSLRIKVENTLDFFVEAWLVLLRIFIIVCSSIYFKKLISEFLDVQEDTHIWELLYSKFSNYKSFHTLMYTCSDVYDFLPWSTIVRLLKSFLIPFVIYNILYVVNFWCQRACDTLIENEQKEKEQDSGNGQDDEDSGIENSTTDNKVKKRKPKEDENQDNFIAFVKSLEIEPHVFYGIAQMVVYGVMAALIMRLKLLFVTQMCIVSGLLMNTKYWRFVLPNKKYIPFLWGILLVPVCIALFENVNKETSYVGQFSDPPLEELLQWISKYTEPSSAFAGSMPLMAAVMLSTRRPVVTHPHYEHHDASLLQWVSKHTEPSSAFAGSMPLMAAVMLSTRRPIVTHPHYEHHDASLLQWVSEHTEPSSAFAGSMPLMAAVVLSTRRPVVTHPNYEHHDARQRTYAVYKMYGRFTAEELYEELTKLKTTYLVVEWQYCYGKSNKNCTFEDIWDSVTQTSRAVPPLCRALLTRAPDHFYPVFRNRRYTVHRLHDVSLR
ncbi:protein C-mannosyl-transferase DPY19L1 [Ostrinia nubilalis]|uniref:protein C-mannosyl-transferase DPY19L1 n=1 Tax=Ostrinia nubilalis TaxID=29057 RepID=UPI00308226ED